MLGIMRESYLYLNTVHLSLFAAFVVVVFA